MHLRGFKDVILKQPPIPTLSNCIGIAVLCLGLSTGASAETRGYAISLIHTATYAHEENCPQGGNGDLFDIQKRILMRHGYTEEQATTLIANDFTDENGEKVDIRRRGVINGQAVDIHTFPGSVPDPEIETVKGRYAYGFDLDGQVYEDSFEHPESGEKGIDNQMWRALGCFGVYNVKRPVIPYNEAIAWDTAIDAMPAWLLSVSGDDLSKDGDVTVTFDRSLNIVMRDARGGVLPSSTYTIDPDPRSHSEFKGRIEDGILTIEPGDFAMQGESQFYAILRFSNTQLRLEMHDDGTLSGHIGGYQPWIDYFHYLAIRGEGTGQVDIPGTYYAMKRLADADPDPDTGENRAISAAYYIEAAPVFHTSVDGETVARAVEGDGGVQQRATAQASYEQQ